MDHWKLAGQRLLQLARPRLAANERDGLAADLNANWSSECLALLLDADDVDVVSVAATCLGLVADMSICPRLAALLHHDEPAVVAAAESALWSVWFRAGGDLGHAVLSKITRNIRETDGNTVIALLTELIRSQPTFAEAYHQRAQARYLAGDYEQAFRDARRTCRLNPSHFAALATQGHCLTAMGRLREAMKTYQAVLRLHPRMQGIRRSIRRIRELATQAAHS